MGYFFTIQTNYKNTANSILRWLSGTIIRTRLPVASSTVGSVKCAAAQILPTGLTPHYLVSQTFKSKAPIAFAKEKSFCFPSSRDVSFAKIFSGTFLQVILLNFVLAVHGSDKTP